MMKCNRSPHPPSKSDPFSKPWPHWQCIMGLEWSHGWCGSSCKAFLLAPAVRKNGGYNLTHVCRQGGGVPRSSQRGGGVLPSSQQGVPHLVDREVPHPAKEGYSHPANRIPPSELDGYPPSLPLRHTSIASTCYVAGGMPLAFTQEDFLVYASVYPLLIRPREIAYLRRNQTSKL